MDCSRASCNGAPCRTTRGADGLLWWGCSSCGMLVSLAVVPTAIVVAAANGWSVPALTAEQASLYEMPDAPV
jgi:hypothetical protein